MMFNIRAAGLLSLFISLSSNAVSLEDLLGQQTVTTIAPVVFEGRPVGFESGQDFAFGPASHLCAALGFPRLVKYKTRPYDCYKLGCATTKGSFGPGAIELKISEDFSRYEQHEIFEEIQCAK